MLRTLTQEVLVPPNKLFTYKEYIEEKINTLVNKNYSNEYGFMQKIVNITTIENVSVYVNDFSGSVIYNVEFIAQFINPQVDDIIECVIEHNVNVILAKADNMKIIVVENEETKDLAIGDKIKIVIKVKQINANCDYIKIVGEFIEKIN